MHNAFAKDCTDITRLKLDPPKITIHVGQQASYFTVPQLYENSEACNTAEKVEI